ERFEAISTRQTGASLEPRPTGPPRGPGYAVDRADRVAARAGVCRGSRRPGRRAGRGMPRVAAIDRLANHANHKTHWTEAAKKAVADRTLRIAVKNGNTVELAELVADMHQLICHVDEGTLHIETRAESDEHHRHEFHRRLADRYDAQADLRERNPEPS
ncbi:hypothetical protein B4Q13_15810, partial [Lacticaseibacillus rhamnosus]